jgi:hypothetical protein
MRPATARDQILIILRWGYRPLQNLATGKCPMTMQSDHHAHHLSDNPAAQLALLATAVIMLIAIGWFYFQ